MFEFEDTQKRVKVRVTSEPNECPECHRTIIPHRVAHRYNHCDPEKLNIFYHCTSGDCGRGFVAEYEYKDKEKEGEGQRIGQRIKEYSLVRILQGSPKTIDFSDHIKEVSPGFVNIYSEAYIAEQQGLLEICGVGYRKALEFLMKDYLVSIFPEKEVEIKKTYLGPCIQNYVSDQKIKSVAKRAVWLGNDETHYERRWKDKGLNDLKKLIELTRHWIEAEIITRELENNMPDS